MACVFPSRCNTAAVVERMLEKCIVYSLRRLGNFSAEGESNYLHYKEKTGEENWVLSLALPHRTSCRRRTATTPITWVVHGPWGCKEGVRLMTAVETPLLYWSAALYARGPGGSCECLSIYYIVIWGPRDPCRGRHRATFTTGMERRWRLLGTRLKGGKWEWEFIPAKHSHRRQPRDPSGEFQNAFSNL